MSSETEFAVALSYLPGFVEFDLIRSEWPGFDDRVTIRAADIRGFRLHFRGDVWAFTRLFTTAGNWDVNATAEQIAEAIGDATAALALARIDGESAR